MRILHLASDWKWTGPAAPLLELVLAQRERGLEAALACPEAPAGSFDSLAARAREAGVEPTLALAGGRGARPWRDAGDLRRLRGLLRTRPFDVLHAWHTRDHVLALRAAGRGSRRAGARVVRSYASAEPIAGLPWNRWLFGPRTDGLLCVSPAAASGNAALRSGRPVAAAFGAVDLQRFRPRLPDPGLRAALGLSPEHRVVGIAARVQRRRRFDLLLDAMARLARRDERARLLVIGRGTHVEEVLRGPARRRGLEGRVVFAGYRRGDYAAVLRCSDVFTTLVPGSDGGCRAVLEAAACAIPAVTTARGALPEIVLHGETGLVAAESGPALCDAWVRLLEDAPLRRRMGEAARRRAESRFSRARLAADVEALYRAVLAGRPTR